MKRGRKPKYRFTDDYEAWLVYWLEQHLPQNGHERTAASLIPDLTIRRWFVSRHFYADWHDLESKPHITVGAFHRAMDNNVTWLRRVRQKPGDSLPVLVRPRSLLGLPYRVDELVDAHRVLLESLAAVGDKARAFDLSKSTWERGLICRAAWCDSRFDQWDEWTPRHCRATRWIARVNIHGELRMKVA